MRLKKKKDDSKTFTYSVDLEKEIEKVGKNLLKVEKALLFVEETYSRVKRSARLFVSKKRKLSNFYQNRYRRIE